MYQKIIVTGSLAYDHIMSMPGKFRDHIMPDKLHILNVSFTMKTFLQEFGGTAGNIAYSLGLLQTRCTLFGAVGNDFSLYKKHLQKQEFIERKIFVFKDKSTSRGFVMTDEDDNQIWSFYEGALSESHKINIAPLLNKDTLLMLSPNQKDAMTSYARQAQSKHCPYIFDPAFNIIHFDKKDLRNCVFGSSILAGNDYEIELITRRLNLSLADILEKVGIVIITLGAKGAVICSGRQKIKISAAKPLNESDPTGAGDAFRAGFIAGYIRDFPLETCGRMGALTAIYSVEKYGTQTHKFTIKGFSKRFEENYGTKLLL